MKRISFCQKIIIMLFFVLPIQKIYGQLANSPWPMCQHDAKHTGKSQYVGPTTPVLSWSYKLCDESWTVGDIAVGSDGTIYVPLSNGIGMSAVAGFLYAINSDGTFKWKYQFEGICTPAISVPAIDDGGTIYVHVNGDLNIMAPDRIYALNPDGTEKWLYIDTHGPYGATVSTNLSSPVIANDGSISFSSTNTSSTRINASGEWLAQLSDNYYNSINSSPALISGDTIFTSEDSSIKAYHSVGGQIWVYWIPGTSSTGDQGSISIDVLSKTIYYSDPDNLFALSFAGTIKWTYPLNTENQEYFSTPAIASYGPVVSTNDGLFAFNKDGSLRWNILKHDYQGGDISPTIDANDIIYWQCQGSLYVINDGSIIGTYTLPGSELSSRQSAVILSDNTILCINNTTLLTLKNIAVGVNDLTPDNYFQFFPNPVNDVLYFVGIENDLTQVSILSIEGKILKQINEKGINQLDLSNLQKGAYFVKIINSKINSTKKFIKL
jgi:hypothetical protein